MTSPDPPEPLLDYDLPARYCWQLLKMVPVMTWKVLADRASHCMSDGFRFPHMPASNFYQYVVEQSGVSKCQSFTIVMLRDCRILSRSSSCAAWALLSSDLPFFLPFFLTVFFF